MREPDKLAEYQQLLRQLLEKNLTLSLGAINQQNQPEVSLVPFLYHKNYFWVFVSELSSHTQCLIDRPDISVLIYDSAKNHANPFSIKRLRVACRASIELEKREEILDVMTLKLGETVSLLRQLDDFRLFALMPMEGRLIAGFGQAFDVDFSAMSLTHIKGPSGG